LLKKAKRQAAESRRTPTAVIENALREALARPTQKVRAKPTRLTTFGAGGLQPGVDLDDTASLIERMDAPDGPQRASPYRNSPSRVA